MELRELEGYLNLSPVESVSELSAAEQIVVFRTAVKAGTTLFLVSNFPYELWRDGTFVGDGGHRCSQGEALEDRWEFASAANVIVRLHLLSRDCQYMTFRALFDEVFFVDLCLSPDERKWEWRIDSTVEFASVVNGNLPRQNRIVGNFLRLSDFMECQLRRSDFLRDWRSRPVPYSIVYRDILTVEHKRFLQHRESGLFGEFVSQLTDDENIFIHSLEFYRDSIECPLNDAEWTLSTFDCGAIGLHRVELTCVSDVVLIYTEVSSLGEVSDGRERCCLADVVGAGTGCSIYGVRGCRYIHIFHPVKSDLFVRLQRREVELTPKTVTFSSKYDVLIDAARNNITACVDGGLTDSCWRERAQWAGDLRMLAIAIRALSTDFSVIDHALRQVSQSYDHSSGMIAALWPAANSAKENRLEISTWHLAFCLAVLEHRQFVGSIDPDLLDMVRNSLLRWRELYLCEGLIRSIPGWTFVDWALQPELNEYRGPQTTHALVNCWYQQACVMAEVPGISFQAFVDAFYLPSVEAWRMVDPRDLPGHASKREFKLERPSLHATAAILASLPGRAGLSWLKAQWPLAPRVTAYFAYFVAAALKKESLDLARKYVYDYYYPIASKLDSIYEKGADVDSRAHGWSVAFVEFLLN